MMTLPLSSVPPKNGPSRQTDPGSDAVAGPELLGAGFTVLLSQLLGNMTQTAPAIPEAGTDVPIASSAAEADLAGSAASALFGKAGASEAQPETETESNADGADDTKKSAPVQPQEKGAKDAMTLESFTKVIEQAVGKAVEKTDGTADLSKVVANAVLQAEPQLSEPHLRPLEDDPKKAGPALDNAAVFQQAAVVSDRTPVPPVGNVRPASATAGTEAFDGKVTVTNDGTRLAVTMEPEGLGKLQIDLRLDHGSINAQINVADQATRSMIERRSHEIVQALMQEGISVGGFSVGLRGNGSGQGPEQNQLSGGHGEQQPGADHVGVESITPAAMQSDRLVSIFV